MDAVDTLYANTRNNPIEDIETHLPLRVLRYELREDVAGAGKWRGGLGSVRKLDLLANGTTHALPSKVPHMNIARDGRFVCYGPTAHSTPGLAVGWTGAETFGRKGRPPTSTCRSS
jgi:N-methylhydantoinase B